VRQHDPTWAKGVTRAVAVVADWCGHEAAFVGDGFLVAAMRQRSEQERNAANEHLATLPSGERRQLRRGSFHLAAAVRPVRDPEDVWGFVDRVRSRLSREVLDALGLSGLYGPRSAQTHGGSGVISGDAPDPLHAPSAAADGDEPAPTVFETLADDEDEVAAWMLTDALQQLPGYAEWEAVRQGETEAAVAQRRGITQ
jgi:hypothetical protein